MSSAARPRLRLAAALVASCLSLALVTACGDDGSESSGECRTLTATDGHYEATIVAKNLQFDVRCLSMGPGTLTLTYDNRDSGVAHDLHVTGMGVNEATDLERGPTKQELTVELTQVGTYTFACDPHATMEGIIRVEDPAGSTTTAG